MSDTKHTPGPWTADGEFIVAPDATGTHRDLYVATIVESDEEGRCAPQAEQAANARLIAAAPEMFDVLADCARWIETLDPDIALGSIMPDKIRAALARASGAPSTDAPAKGGGA